jgi:hypothetical protein
MTIFHRLLPRLLALVAVALLPSCASRPNINRQHVSENSRYLPGPPVSKLQTPCYVMTDGAGRRVELIGAVHLAKKSYYQEINRRFRSFDAVLVESVGDPRSKKKEGGSAPSPVFRKIVHEKFQMVFQQEVVDYDRPYIIHADFTTAGYAEARRRHGLGERAKGSPDEAALVNLQIEILSRGVTDIQRAFAVEVHDSAQKFPGSRAERQVDVEERERIALDVLERQLAAGKRKLCIFYGSGHLPSLRDELISRGWKLSGVEWLDAWVIPHAN